MGRKNPKTRQHVEYDPTMEDITGHPFRVVDEDDKGDRMKRKSPKKRVYKFDKTGDTGPGNYEYMSELQAKMKHKARIKNQEKNRKKQLGE